VTTFVRPRVILGTMPFGQQVPEEAAEEILRQFVGRHTGETRPQWELDTGACFPCGQCRALQATCFVTRKGHYLRVWVCVCARRCARQCVCVCCLCMCVCAGGVC
jgi:hypothetical protein